ncbi:sensor histidine kinase [Luteimonas kalidii]|uniref:histidine kinase n=1 Tax=Luteimonas kalidii TaxID=3042025 RepID=A0ABT6JQ91_9GAMM|nr:ATP-binding protein [Luteimonas kalidii]MDH5832856.1 ATP-binding protein [Luteimonas kalidii]
MIRAPRSLRTRLLAALAIVLFTGWAGWFALQYVQMSKRQVGDLDGMIRNVAEQILQSLPEDITGAAQQPRRFELDLEEKTALGKFDLLAFQAWDLDARRRLVSSRSAPAQAMVDDFEDGFTSQSIDGVPWRVYSVRDLRGAVQVQVGIPEAAVHLEMRRWFHTSLGTALALLLTLGLAVWLVIEWSLRPVARLGEALNTRAPLDFASLPDAGLPSEVVPLVQGFNRLLERLAQALQHEREFLGEAAHELRTPLAALLAQAQVLQHAGDRDEARTALAELISGIERTARLAQQLLDAARVEAGGGARETDLDLALVAGMVADEFAQVATREGRALELDLRHAPVRGDIDDLGILVRNLLDNALRHGGPGARVRLTTAVAVEEGTRIALLAVADDGPGIPDADRERVFERFYRGGNGHRTSGIGMGLSLVQRVVAAHGGQVRCVAGIDGRGCGVEVRLPVRAGS